MTTIERLEALHAEYMRLFLYATDEAPDPSVMVAEAAPLLHALPALLRVAKLAQRAAENGCFDNDDPIQEALDALEEVTP